MVDEIADTSTPLLPPRDNQGAMHGSHTATVDVERLYRDHHAFVRNCLRRFRLHDDELDDAVHDVFAVMLGRAGEQLDRSRSVRAWLFGVSRNLARNTRRRAARRSRLIAHASEPLPAATPEDHVARTEAAEVLARFFARVDPQVLASFVLLDIEGLGAREAAERIGLPVTTVRWRARVARAELERVAQDQPPRSWAAHVVWLWPWRSARLGPWMVWLVTAAIALAWLVGGFLGPRRTTDVAAEVDDSDAAPADASVGRAAKRAVGALSEIQLDPAGASVAGRVLDSDGRPIAQALVCRTIEVSERQRSEDIDPQCTRSDGNGQYHFEGVRAGVHRVGASARGFLPADHAGTLGLGVVNVAAASRLAAIDIVLRSGGAKVSGVVTDETGGVVGNAIVRAQDHGRFAQSWTAVAMADDDGRFELWGPSGGMSLEVTADGYATATGHANAPQADVELRLMPEVVLSGRVIDGAGNPVPYVRVRANPESHNAGEIMAFSTTNDDGRFALRRLGPGRYRPTAEGDATFGQAPSFVTVALAVPAPDVTIVTSHAASVHVKLEAPAPLAGCEGEWLEGFSATHRYVARVTDGQATLRGIPQGPLHLLVVCRGQRSERVLDVGATDHLETSLRVEAGATVSGRVPVDAEGLGSNMAIHLIPAGSAPDGPMLPAGTMSSKTNANGEFSVAAPGAGEYETFGGTVSGVWLPLARLTLADGEHRDLGELSLPALGRIEGRVVDGDGRGVPGLSVDAPGHPGIHALTRSDGTFSITHVLPGTYQLRARQRFVRLGDDSLAVTVVARTVSSATLSVPTLDGTITGIVVDAEGEAVADAEIEIAAIRPGLAEERTFRVVARTRADGDGRFHVTQLLPGEHEVAVSALVGPGAGDENPRCEGLGRAHAKARAGSVSIACL